MVNVDEITCPMGRRIHSVTTTTATATSREDGVVIMVPNFSDARLIGSSEAELGSTNRKMLDKSTGNDLFLIRTFFFFFLEFIMLRKILDWPHTVPTHAVD